MRFLFVKKQTAGGYFGGFCVDNTCKLEKNNVKFNDFRLCYCGYEECDPLHSFGPSVKSHFVIHYVIDGKGKLCVRDECYEIGKGQAFLIEPNVKTFYEADKDEPWTYLWVGFDGDKTREYLSEMNLNRIKSPVFSVTNGLLLKRIVLDMLKHNTIGIENEFILQGLLCQFFAVIASEKAKKSLRNEKASSENYYIKKAQDFVRDNYSNAITVADIATYVGLNRSYLFTLFQQNVGIPPQKYLSNFRLEKASDLLKKSTYSVEEIARSCGYRDPLVFSKAFKKLFGVSPIKYRREC